jgi:hypothetical protein
VLLKEVFQVLPGLLVPARLQAACVVVVLRAALCCLQHPQLLVAPAQVLQQHTMAAGLHLKNAGGCLQP